MARFANVRKFCIYAKFAYVCKSGHVYTALLGELGFMEAWLQQNVGNEHDFLSLVKQRLNKKLAASKAYSISPAMCSCWNIAKFKNL